MALPLDQIDQKILQMLAQDGRSTCSEMARVIGHITERSVRYRLDKLLQQKIVRVRGFLDPDALGYPVSAVVQVTTEPGAALQLGKQLAKMDQVTYIACLADQKTILLNAVASDEPAIYEFATSVLKQTPGVQDIHVSINPQVIKNVDSWQPPRDSLSNNRFTGV